MNINLSVNREEAEKVAAALDAAGLGGILARLDRAIARAESFIDDDDEASHEGMY